MWITPILLAIMFFNDACEWQVVWQMDPTSIECCYCSTGMSQPLTAMQAYRTGVFENCRLQTQTLGTQISSVSSTKHVICRVSGYVSMWLCDMNIHMGGEFTLPSFCLEGRSFISSLPFEADDQRSNPPSLKPPCKNWCHVLLAFVFDDGWITWTTGRNDIF